MPTHLTTLPEVLRKHAADHPDRVFASVGPAQRTYAEMLQASQRVAAGMERLGVDPGDRVAAILPNCVEMLELIFGLAELGGIQVPLNIYLRGDFLRHQLADSGATAVVVDRAGLEAVDAIAGQLPDLKVAVLVDDDLTAVTAEAVRVVPFTRLVDSGAPAAAHPHAPGAALAVLYTSGTTGLSKGCVVSHGYHLNVGAAFAEMFGVRDDEVIFTAMPLFHNGGQAQALMMALVTGTTVVFEPSFSASQYLQHAAEAEATVLHGVGMMAMALLGTPPADDVPTKVRLAGFGPLPGALQLLVEERFGFPVLAEGYGQSECVPISFSRHDSDRHRDSAGRPVPWLDVSIVDDEDLPVQPGDTGEIVIRPRRPNVMFQGYWNNPEATLEAMAELWFHTGDLGRIDEHGYLFFIDRKKDALRRRGENVSSMEVEQAIGRHPSVQQVAVHAVASEMTEDDIKACLVLVPGAEVTPKELFEYFKAHLPYFAIPRYVEVLASLPATAATFRVMKQALRDRGVTDATWDLDALGLVVERDERR